MNWLTISCILPQPKSNVRLLIGVRTVDFPYFPPTFAGVAAGWHCSSPHAQPTSNEERGELLWLLQLQQWLFTWSDWPQPPFPLWEQKDFPSAKTMYAAINWSRVQAAISFYNCDFISHLQFIFTTVISFHMRKIVRRNHIKFFTSVKSFRIRKITVHQQKKCTTAKEIVQAAKESAKTISYCYNTLHDKTPKTRSCPRPSTHPAIVVVAPMNPPVALSRTRPWLHSWEAEVTVAINFGSSQRWSSSGLQQLLPT